MKKIIFKILILIMISIIISCSNENSGTKKENIQLSENEKLQVNENSGTKKENIQLSENEKLQVFDMRYLTSENGEYLYLNVILEENSKSVFVDYVFYENQSINAFIFDTEINRFVI